MADFPRLTIVFLFFFSLVGLLIHHDPMQPKSR